MFGRTIAGSRFTRAVLIARIPAGSVTRAVASEPFERRGRQAVILRLDSGEYALALSSESPSWHWPTPGGVPFTVMLYRADGERSASKEIRRLLDPRRRDALCKAEVHATTDDPAPRSGG